MNKNKKEPKKIEQYSFPKGVNRKNVQRKSAMSEPRPVILKDLTNKLKFLPWEIEVAKTETLLHWLFDRTPIDFYHSAKPVIRDAIKPKNIYSVLRQGHNLESDSEKRKDLRKDSWEALKSNFKENAKETFTAVEKNMRMCIGEHKLTQSLVEEVNKIYQEYNGKSYCIDADLCYRELTMLFLQSLFGKNAYEKYHEWVETGEWLGLLSQIPDKNEKFFTSGFFALPINSINEVILPRLKLEPKQDSKYQGSLPLLEQILHCDTRHRIFVLCGDENEGTTVSGAGKTTMLQHLYYSWENAIFVPLSRVYCNHRYSIRRDMKHSDAYILPWLQKYYKIWKQSDLDNRLLILDGLDEIREASGVQAICDDLFWLIEKCTPRIVISSKLRPDKLTTWDYEPTVGLCTVSDYVWRVAEYCYILPMNKDQRRKYLGDNVSPELESILTTPFFLSLYKNVKETYTNKESRHNTILAAWSQLHYFKTEIRTKEDLLYRFFVAQICRWSDENTVDSTRTDADAFFLMYTLPMIAYRMASVEFSDAQYIPAPLNQADETFVTRALDNSDLIFSHVWVYRHPGEGNTFHSVKRYLTAQEFDKGRASIFLCRIATAPKWEWEHYFAHHAIRNELATLHIANIFYMAYYDKLLEDDTLSSYFAFLVQYPSQTMYEEASHYLDALLGEKDRAKGILLDRSSKVKVRGAYAAFLLCMIAREMSLALHLDEEVQRDWIDASATAYQKLEKTNLKIANWHKKDYLVRILGGQAASLRAKGQFKDAAKKSQEAIKYAEQDEGFGDKNKFGYHSLAKVYFEQIRHLLNCEITDSQYIEFIQGNYIDHAKDIHMRLKMLRDAKIQGQWSDVSGSMDLFGKISYKNMEIIEPICEILDKAKLRLDRYSGAKDEDGRLLFEKSSQLKFLLEASYVGKVFSSYAAFHEGASGEALNMLGTFMQNQQEELENNRDLKFFISHPDLHCDMNRDELLLYTNNHIGAFYIFLRIYNIKRGGQPYPARKLAEIILNRRVRLAKDETADEGFRPIIGPGDSQELNEVEVKFLDQVTERVCTSNRGGFGIFRIRYLNEKKTTASIEAERRFEVEWTRCGCTTKFEEDKVDFNSAQLLAEFTKGWRVTANTLNMRDAVIKILHFFQRSLREFEEVKYTTGTRMIPQYYEECLNRLQILSDQQGIKVFSELSSQSNNWWRSVRDELKNLRK